jgi:hypothetical protein
VGNPRETKGYYFYNKVEGNVFVTRNGVFLEKEFLPKEVSGSKVQLEEIQKTPENVSAPTNPVQEVQDVVPPDVEAPAPHRSIRAHRVAEKFTLLTTEQRDILLLDNDESMTYTEAMMGPDSEKWLGAMESEIESMHDNQVWNLVDPIDGVRPIICKWGFKKNTDKDGNVHIYKARLVAKDFKQIHGIDYDRTFSLIVMLKSVQILLAIVAYFDYEILHMDVKTTFFNGNLTEHVYMTQPEDCGDTKHAGKICKLQKFIYGLKQASQSCNLRFDEVIKSFGFIKNVKESCVYKKVSESTFVFLVLYLNDILLIGNDIPMLEVVKSSLRKSFSMKDLGEATYILDIKIYRDNSKRVIGLSQDAYINKILNRFNMQDSKKCFLPMSHGIKLSKNQCLLTPDEQERMRVIPYASAIGPIIYTILCTLPDVSYALSVMSRYQSNYGEPHWIIVKNILK